MKPIEKIGQYEVIDNIYTRDNYACYLACGSDDTNYVIKAFDLSLLENSSAELKAARQLQDINHSKLVRIIEVKRDTKLKIYYYVMECWGDDLRNTIRVKPDPKIALDIVKQTLEGLAELHRHKLVHRDIKPENIFLKGNQVKIGDYGLVKSQRYVTQLTTIAGTRDYMAPEVLDGKPYDHRCDIYSVGIVLLELLTQSTDIPKQRPDDIKEWFWNKVIIKAIAQDPNERFSSIDEFIKVFTEEVKHFDAPVDYRKYLEKPKHLVQPDWSWYSGISRRNNLPLNCPLANLYLCPRYYLSISLLTESKIMAGISAEQNRYLKEKWSKSRYYPTILEEQPGLVFAGEKGAGSLFMFNCFCPEVAASMFVFYVSDAAKYADELDMNNAQQQLAQDGISTSDWRWLYASVTSKHYTECKEYSIGDKLKPILTENEDEIRRSQHIQEINKKYENPSFVANTDEIVNKAVKKIVTMSGIDKGTILYQDLLERTKTQDARLTTPNASPIFQKLDIQRYPPKPEMRGQDNPGVLVKTLQAKIEKPVSITELIVNGAPIGTTKSEEVMLPIAEEWVKAVEKRFGRQNSRTADAIDKLAEILLKLKNYEGAITRYKESLKLDEEIYGQHSRQYVASLYRLAQAYLESGDYLMPKTYYGMALSFVIKGYNEEAIIRNNLAGVHYLQKEYQPALNHYQEALSINELRNSRISEPVAINLYNMALTYEAMGNAGTAEPLYKQAKDTLAKLPPDKITLSEQDKQRIFSK
jgi:serine/threonine protein kinase